MKQHFPEQSRAGTHPAFIVAGRGGERPPAEWPALLAYLQGLATPTIYNAVKNSTLPVHSGAPRHCR